MLILLTAVIVLSKDTVVGVQFVVRFFAATVVPFYSCVTIFEHAARFLLLDVVVILLYKVQLMYLFYDTKYN